MKDIIEYINLVLVGEENRHLMNMIAYGEDNPGALIRIKPSTFFNEEVYLKETSMPCLPLGELNGIPILYGEPKVEKKDGFFIVHADIIASTFFLISRYEECLKTQERDLHGRFLGEYTILKQTGNLMRPLVDEYRELLYGYFKELGVPIYSSEKGFRKIYLTHDVDHVWQWGNLYCAMRTFLKRFIKKEKNVLESLLAWYDFKKYDSIYTFPWLVEKDNKVRQIIGEKIVTSIYFVMGCGRGEYDSGYIRKRNRVRNLVEYLTAKEAVIGMHTSYRAGRFPEEVKNEKKELERVTGLEISCNRNHYLASRNPVDMKFLCENEIRDDFTMGYADTVGFRLGTCRSVKWIDPIKLKVTNLTLHPMTVMECTLDGPKYMNLNAEEAYKVVCDILDIVYCYHGEVVLLWHNSTVAKGSKGYQRELYEKVLKYIEGKMKNAI